MIIKRLIRSIATDSEINSPFLLNEHGDPRLFLLLLFLFFRSLFAKNSVIKNIFEGEKRLIVVHDFFFWKNSSQLGVLWPRQGLQANHGTVSVRNEAILLMSINEVLLSR